MTRIVQDPDFKGRGLLTEIRVHDSVLERIERGPDGYAPIVLPPRYCVEGGVQREQHAPRRAAAQESVWDLVWRRRVNYFLTLGLTFGLVALAVLPRFLPSPASTCIGPQCFISPWLRAVGNLLPSFATAWIESFADRPATFLVLALSIVWLLRSTRRIELSMRDTMRRLFRLSIRSPADAPGELRRIARAAGCIRRLRSSLRYQKSMQFLKWRAAPGVAAGIIYAVSCVLAVTFLSSILNMAHRGHLVWAERSEAFCRDSASADVPVVGDEAVFATSDMCWRVPGATVVEGERYRLRMDVEAPWSDGFEANSDTSNDAVRVRWRDALVQRLAARSGGPIAASPEGFDTRRFTWWTRWPATLLRRSTSDPWFRPLVHVEGHTRAPWAFQSVPMRLVDYGDRTYVGEFTAPATGTVVLSVNDAVLLWGGRRDLFYAGNRGTARVALEACNGDLDVPCDFADREN